MELEHRLVGWQLVLHRYLVARDLRTDLELQLMLAQENGDSSAIGSANWRLHIYYQDAKAEVDQIWREIPRRFEPTVPYIDPIRAKQLRQMLSRRYSFGVGLVDPKLTCRVQAWIHCAKNRKAES